MRGEVSSNFEEGHILCPQGVMHVGASGISADVVWPPFRVRRLVYEKLPCEWFRV